MRVDSARARFMLVAAMRGSVSAGRVAKQLLVKSQTTEIFAMDGGFMVVLVSHGRKPASG